MVRGIEFHDIINNVFDGDVENVGESEQIRVNCPMCQERDGLSYPDGKHNLEINTAKRVFRCWKCDEPKFSGTIRKLIKKFGSDVDYKMYVSYANILGEITYDNYDDEIDEIVVKLPDEMILFSQMNVNNSEHVKAYNYLITEREISRELIFKYRLGFCIEGKYANRIIIPSYDIDGEINYFVARAYMDNMKKPYDNPKVSKNIVFNGGVINWDSTVYLVEGVFEMLSFPVNTIPLLGKNIPDSLFQTLKELKPNVVILLDPDAFKSSIGLFYKIYSIYVGYEDRVKIVKLNGEYDFDELRKKYGRNKMIEELYGARGLTIDDYFVNKIENSYGGDRNGYDTYKRYFNAQ